MKEIRVRPRKNRWMHVISALSIKIGPDAVLLVFQLKERFFFRLQANRAGNLHLFYNNELRNDMRFRVAFVVLSIYNNEKPVIMNNMIFKLVDTVVKKGLSNHMCTFSAAHRQRILQTAHLRLI